MKNSLKIHMKPRERFFINGAVIRVDRKVTIELLNDVKFLLESHVMQEEGATTPLRQLYFVVQSMIIEPNTIDIAMQIYENQHRYLIMTYKDVDLLSALVEVKNLIEVDRAFDALRKIRSLFPLEDAVLSRDIKSTLSVA